MLTELSLRSQSGSWFRNRKNNGSAIVRVGQLGLDMQLENRITCSATPVAAQFDAVTNYGVRQIRVEGQNLLTGCGFGFIGSETGVDDRGNITSCRDDNGGVMRPFNGSQTPNLPFSLTFRRDTRDPSKLFFEGRIGPSNFDFRTVSMPMDSVRGFTYWRHSGSSAVGRYDQNPYAYTPPGGGPIYIRSAPGNPTWGEIIGVDYTIRVTRTSSSRPMPLAFVEAPHLGVGVRNVEFSFGGVSRGQSATVSGHIQVFRTDASILPRTVFESESHPYHQIGRRDGDGWSVNVNDRPGQFMNYGPYTTALPAGNRVATFRLLLDNVSSADHRILRIEVYDCDSNRVIAWRDLTRRQFARAMQYQDFDLAFTAAANRRLEFRTFWYGGSYVRQDHVRVR